jgi:hypothetical protein
LRAAREFFARMKERSVLSMKVVFLGASSASTWVAKPEVHAEVRVTS